MNKRRKIILRFAAAVSLIAVASLIGVFAVARFAIKNVNTEIDERLFERSREVNSTVFYASESRGSGNFDETYIPVELESTGAFRKSFYSLEENSKYLIDGFVAVEDRSFFEHSGIDIKRTLLAAINYIFKTDKRFGASTITQQVIKNISGDNQPTLKRKLSELIRAVRIEHRYSKSEIMEVYLNIIPMSENVFGAGTASRTFFGKEPSEITVAEAATLIGITNAPSAYNPYNNPEKCTKKRNSVLLVMYNEGVISKEEYEKAIKTPLSVIPREEREDIYDSWFVETVMDELSRDMAEQYGTTEDTARLLLSGGGYKVYTTADISVQNTLESYFENLSNFSPEVKNGLNYAMTVCDSKTGNLLGIVGRVGEKRANRILNHALVPHIPASALKPIALYAPLIDEGKINWASVIDDVPQSFYERDGEYVAYPKNSPDVYDGLTTVADAVRKSKNTVAVKLCNMRGVERVYKTLEQDFGFNTLVRSEKGANGATLTDLATSPLALGQLTHGVSLRSLTEAYTAFAADGVLNKSRSYLAVVDSEGKTVIEKTPKEKRVFDKSTARIMNKLLMGVVENGTAESITIKNKVDTAGKTGTSSSNREKMFIGYTPYFTAGIWCGYESGTGSVASVFPTHLAVWDDIVTKLHSDIDLSPSEHFSDEGLLYLPYCMDSGELYSTNCLYDVRGSRLAYGYFTSDNQPTHSCTRHVVCSYDSVAKGVADVLCPNENIVKVSLLDISDRAFPKEIYVTDAEYVCRNISGFAERPTDSGLPYFYYALPEGEYVGISKREKQFNSACTEHRH